ncbi:MAG: dTDP-4-dehydrorhamnose reductase [Planctomycetes bacterium]|nr:dTDP-4-dehydrorhamnose reductase [Planctomycetota bacterium]
MTDNKKIVVLGAGGMLGTDLRKTLEQRGYQAVGLDLPEFDICDAGQLKVAVDTADILINCAAYTNVEKAETDERIAYKVNADAVGMLGEFACEKNIPVIHISTDFVFDGEGDRPYTEEDSTNAISVYGASKLAGEQKLIESGARACIIRVQWTYGHAGTNFIKKLFEFAQTRDTLKVVDDQVGAPTATVEVSAAICRIIAIDAEFPVGIFHFAAGGYVSRYEMAKFAFEKKGMTTVINPCKSDEFPTAAARPLNSRFDCTKIERLLGEKIKAWPEPLEEFLDQL